MDRVLNEIDDSILLVSQFCQQIEQKSGDEIMSQIVQLKRWKAEVQ